ncbi:hypothetical protein BT93_L0253 [Corymbia citriodora subsp. variegata]|uniref:Uncharacterized protein n=1 Tax=Corymbia citriodora subsp. variegata TaxID=360336 RepID=A0A8T0CQF7_CORYI|nr:hypothetical protein BT93_L0253 [Corymbia citriodora subsp. variegata]
MLHQHNHSVKPVVLHGEVKHGLLSGSCLFDRVSIMQRDSSRPSLHGAQVCTHFQELLRDLNITTSCRDVQQAETTGVHFFHEPWHMLQVLSDEIQMAARTNDVQRRVTSSFKSHLLQDLLIAADQVIQLMDIALSSCF